MLKRIVLVLGVVASLTLITWAAVSVDTTDVKGQDVHFYFAQITDTHFRSWKISHYGHSLS